MDRYTTFFCRGIAALLLAANAQALAAIDLGYCTNSVDRNNIFRIGSAEKQGLAVRLGAGKLAALKGCTISSISTAVGSKRMTDGQIQLFIATAPDAEPLVSQTVAVSAATKWLTFSLDKPYTISGDETSLYIGYTGEISTNSSMLMSDFTADCQGCSYAYKDGVWTDMYGMGYGNASIRIGIDDAPSITDAVMKPLDAEGYFKAGNDYVFTGQLFNFGTETMKSFDLSVSIEGQAPARSHVEGVSIAPGETYDFTLPAWCSESEGSVELSMAVENVNGTPDSDPTDNAFTSSLFCYPSAMERAILLEGFTGQSCSNCPSGHATISQFMETARETPVIEVMHHAGYQPDFFTMDADLDYTYLYGSSSTYAPAMMLNRTTVMGTVPVMNVTASAIEYAYQLLSASQPYASLSLVSSFDPATRQTTVELSTYAHRDMPTSDMAVNVMLVQDKMVAKQVPYGEGYIHNAVCRGVLAGNAWGVAIDKAATKAGGRYSWSKTFTMPEAIFSDSYDPSKLSEEDVAKRTWPVVPEDMRLVAYVAAYGDTPSSQCIYNAIEVPLGSSMAQGGFPTAIREVEGRQTPRISVNGGHLSVEGGCEALRVYSLNGTAMDAAALPRGIYIVSIVKEGTVHTMKVSVR